MVSELSRYKRIILMDRRYIIVTIPHTGVNQCWLANSWKIIYPRRGYHVHELSCDAQPGYDRMKNEGLDLFDPANWYKWNLAGCRAIDEADMSEICVFCELAKCGDFSTEDLLWVLHDHPKTEDYVARLKEIYKERVLNVSACKPAKP